MTCLSILFIYDNDTACWFGLVGITDCVCWSVGMVLESVPSSGCVPNELKQYLDQPLLERKSDPIKFWVNCRHFTPVLSDIALKYLICQASSVSSERVASMVNLAMPNDRSRLTGEHIKQRVLLMSISDKYWFE